MEPDGLALATHEMGVGTGHLLFLEIETEYCIYNNFRNHKNLNKNFPLSYKYNIIKEKGVINIMYYVYILINKDNYRTYVGHTHDLAKRVWEHKNHVDPNSYTAKYNITKLVYYEYGEDFYATRSREAQIKDYRREKKFALIESQNPYFRELYYDLF